MKAAGWALGLALPLLGLLAHDAWRLRQALQYNAAFEAPVAADVGGAPALVLFVRGHAAARDGQPQQALAWYKDAASDPAVAVAALYNSGNLHLRQALAAQMETDAPPLQAVELAKQQFREALRREPGHWPSRYNLERALWLAPELAADDSANPPPENSERAIATMRGFTIGLP